jgi:predicted Zn-dependent peptidase
MWSDPAATEVRVSIRVHSGSAFDPQGKEGTMQLLADNIFPTPASKSYFTEDLGGSIEVITNYDYIQVNATAKPSEFVTLVETLAQSVSKLTIDKETTASLKKSLLEKLTALEKDPAYIADQAAARRLFGTFPYGRPQMGSVESIQRVDFADLQFARDRLFSADNASVAISGNFPSDLGFRAVRRYFGAWLKSDKRAPNTFRQPDDPDAAPVVLILDGVPRTSVFGLRGLSKADPDYAASLFLERILGARLQKSDPKAEVLFSARTLPGMVRLRAAALPPTLLTAKIANDEFSQAQMKLNEIQRSCEQVPSCLARAEMDRWLDIDTYGPPIADAKALQNVTLADVQRVADRLAKNPVATVIINPPPRAE